MTVEGCGSESLQGDVRFAEVMGLMGADVRWSPYSITITGDRPPAFIVCNTSLLKTNTCVTRSSIPPLRLTCVSVCVLKSLFLGVSRLGSFVIVALQSVDLTVVLLVSNQLVIIGLLCYRKVLHVAP